MVIPAVFTFMGNEGLEASGPSLMFKSLPKVFNAMGGVGVIIGIVFFIAVFFAAVAAVYPKVGFMTRKVEVNRDWNEIREEALEFFKDRRYELESETADKITFRIKGVQGRLAKMYEDRVTVTRVFDGYEFEGLRKDVLRIATGFETRFYKSTEA